MAGWSKKHYGQKRGFRDDINVKREYNWHNCTVSYVVSAIAGRYNLTPAISTELANLEIDHADQTQESDISFLTRMAEMLGASTTIKNGMLLFFSRPVLAERHCFRVADRDAYTGVEAYWLDLNFGKKRKTRVRGQRKNTAPKSSSREGHYLNGAEGNVYVMRQTFKTELAAKRVAVAKWQSLKRVRQNSACSWRAAVQNFTRSCTRSCTASRQTLMRVTRPSQRPRTP
ncbi:unnamed protein product [Penicillium salamii]|nr:unnamed protein product [Penicillium salamii]